MPQGVMTVLIVVFAEVCQDHAINMPTSWRWRWRGR